MSNTKNSNNLSSIEKIKLRAIFFKVFTIFVNQLFLSFFKILN